LGNKAGGKYSNDQKETGDDKIEVTEKRGVALEMDLGARRGRRRSRRSRGRRNLGGHFDSLELGASRGDWHLN